MMGVSTQASPSGRGETGARVYDAIQFSGAPRADRLSRPGTRIQAVRHIAIGGPPQAHAKGRLANINAALVNLSTSTRHCGKIGELRVDKPLQRGNVSFIPHDCTTELEFPAAHSALVLFIPETELSGIVADLGGTEIRPIASERHDRLAQLITMVCGELQTPGFASDLMVDGLIRAIAATLVKHNTVSADADSARIHLSPVRLARVIDFIEARLDSEIHLSDLAQIVGLSPFHFSRVFKLATGETPYHFVGSRRLERARSLLVGTDMPLAELALACGFSSQSHFTAAFTKTMNVPPGRYRRMRGQ